MTDSPAQIDLVAYVQQRFASAEHAVEVALDQVQEALGKTEVLQVERVEAVRREVKTALDAANIAIGKSDAAAEKRFATIDELRKQIQLADERAMGRMEAEQEFQVVRRALEGLENVKANEQLQQERMEGLRREAAALQVANVTAIAKEAAASEKRFEAVNAFRAQMADQAQRYIPREVVEAMVSELRGMIAATGARSQERADVSIARITDLELRLSSRLDQTQGASANASRATTIAIAVVGLIITVVIFLANFLTGTA